MHSSGFLAALFFFFYKATLPECLIRSVFSLHLPNQLTFPRPSIFPIFTVFLLSTFGNFLSFFRTTFCLSRSLTLPSFHGCSTFPLTFSRLGERSRICKKKMVSDAVKMETMQPHSFKQGGWLDGLTKKHKVDIHVEYFIIWTSQTLRVHCSNPQIFTLNCIGAPQVTNYNTTGWILSRCAWSDAYNI